MKLEKGRSYDTVGLQFEGWTEGDGSGHEGYHVADYFTDDGIYLGPDEYGVEPLFCNEPREFLIKKER